MSNRIFKINWLIEISSILINMQSILLRRMLINIFRIVIICRNQLISVSVRQYVYFVVYLIILAFLCLALRRWSVSENILLLFFNVFMELLKLMDIFNVFLRLIGLFKLLWLINLLFFYCLQIWLYWIVFMIQIFELLALCNILTLFIGRLTLNWISSWSHKN